MSKFIDSKREMMETMLNTTNKNAEVMLSSLKSVETSMNTFTSHIRDTQTHLTEMKTATRPILSHENDPENTVIKSQSSHVPEACSKQDECRNDARIENDDRCPSLSCPLDSLPPGGQANRGMACPPRGKLSRDILPPVLVI